MPDESLRNAVRDAIYGPPEAREPAFARLGEGPQPVDPEEFVRSCLDRALDGRAPGIHRQVHFELPRLRERYPQELLNFVVPEQYDPKTPFGLMVLLHGGGDSTPREAGTRWVLEADREDCDCHFGRDLMQKPYITVAPGNLLLATHERWSNPESDAYLLAVIEEACYRYSIDPNRICIGGQSMGAFGTYHTVQALGDRFALTGAHAGAWYYGFWEGLRSVSFHIMHGRRDAVRGTRPRFTDLPFARMASAILSGFHIPHTYDEHDGGHSFSDPPARASFLRFLKHAESAVREPFPKRVVTASRKGAFGLYDAPHHYWISIDAVRHGSFELDHMEPTESNPSYITTDFRHRTIRAHGGTVHAVNEGNNRFVVSTHNVERFSLWLSPQMVDFERPVEVIVDGMCYFDALVKPSLRTTVESYLRKRDEGQLCRGKIDLNIKVDDWERQKGLEPVG